MSGLNFLKTKICLKRKNDRFIQITIMHRKTRYIHNNVQNLSTTRSTIKELNLNYFGDLPWTNYYAQFHHIYKCGYLPPIKILTQIFIITSVIIHKVKKNTWYKNFSNNLHIKIIWNKTRDKKKKS